MAYGPRPLLVFPCLSSTTASEKRHSVTSSREPSPAVEYIERCTTPSSLGRGASPRSWSSVHIPVFPLQILRPHGVAGDALRSASATSDNAQYGNVSVVAGVSHPRDSNQLKKKSRNYCGEVPCCLQHADNLNTRPASPGLGCVIRDER